MTSTSTTYGEFTHLYHAGQKLPSAAGVGIRFTNTATVAEGGTALFNINDGALYYGKGQEYFQVNNGADSITLLKTTPQGWFNVVFEVPVRWNEVTGGWGGIEVLVNGSSIDYVLESTAAASHVTQFSGTKKVQLAIGDAVTFRLNAVEGEMEYGRISLPAPALQNPRCIIHLETYI
ncbi:MAG TPA: hypothetical protein VLL52_22325 [Anaerolineae bacterium]|nr:hypothetical protein [Anaerolineae bacterium]